MVTAFPDGYCRVVVGLEGRRGEEVGEMCSVAGGDHFCGLGNMGNHNFKARLPFFFSGKQRDKTVLYAFYVGLN